MAACSTPLTSIAGTDCIGDSRIVINNNFNLLSQDLCTLHTAVNTLTGTLNTRITTLSSFVKSLSAKDSPTIDLSFNSNAYFLSADVINSSLGTVKFGQDVTTFGKQLLTSTSIHLSSLAGVKLTASPIPVGQVLKWDGTFWTNQTDSVNLTGLLTDGNKVDITVSNSGTTWNINPGVVNSTELANNAVIEAKIYDGSVTVNKIGASAVIESKIATNAVTTAKISAQAVTEPKIAANAITTTKILDDNVTDAKLATVPGYSVKGNSTASTANPSNIQATTANTVLRFTGSQIDFGLVPNEATTGTSSNTGNTLVLRNSSGNFSAGTITSNVIGNVTGNVTGKADRADRLETTRRFELSGVVLGSSNFNGTSTATFNTTFRPDIQENLDYLNTLATFMGIRMSLSPSFPITTTDIKNTNTLYIHPFNGTTVSLWNNSTSKWELKQLTSVLPVNLASLAANTNYDVYLFFSSGTFQVEFVPWGTHSAGSEPPSTGIWYGVLVKSGEPNKRLIGCIRTTNAGQTEVSFGRTSVVGGSFPKFYVWNLYNQQPASFSILETGVTAGMNYWDSTGAGATAGANGPFEKFGGVGAFGNKIGFISRTPQVVTLNSVLYLANNTCTYYSYSLDLETPTTAQLFTKTPGVPIFESCGAGSLTQAYTNTITPGYHYLQIVSMTYAGTGQRYYVWTGERHSYGTIGTIAAY